MRGFIAGMSAADHEDVVVILAWYTFHVEQHVSEIGFTHREPLGLCLRMVFGVAISVSSRSP